MLKKYNVSIKAPKNAPQIADNVIKEFDCEVSDPSSWLEPGTSTQRGLTFLDKKGNQLDSSIFRNMAFFDLDGMRSASDEKAIETLIYKLLYDHYQFEKADVSVTVTSV
ncbi:MAG: hypothetical protein H7Y42_00210 [Chitinophagaceae bacterium]|nr:hypothetical protein [Chitinophagaceae bacterium]